jgi:aspartyl-tRNA(Asn)/glutamyl-tRNA(Gln) amidotransferase subunit A
VTATGAVALAARINEGAVPPDTGIRQSRAAIDRFNGELNAIVDFNPGDADEQVEQLAVRLEAGERPPLSGVPIAVKDHIRVRGWRYSEGSRLFRDRIADHDDLVVVRLREAGAIIIGRTNMSEFGCKGNTTNLLYGATRNPCDTRLTPGGSSGGAASAVAGGLVPLALAGDGGGSIRRPAAHVGAVGLKPSAGVVAEPDDSTATAVLGPIAMNVADCRAMFEAIAGPDSRDPLSIPRLVEGEAPSRARLAYSPRLGLDVPVDDAVAIAIEAAVEKLRAAGFMVESADPEWPAGASEEALMPIQHAALADQFGEAWRSNPEWFDPDIGDQIRSGLTLSGAEVSRAHAMSLAIARSAARFFAAGYDFLLSPTTPCTAWPVAELGPREIGGRPVGPRGHAVFTPFFNHAFCPAITLPVPVAGLPVGLQIAAPRFRDRQLLDLAARVEAALRRAS